MTSNQSKEETEQHLTVSGITSGERRALQEAVYEANTEFRIRHSIDVTNITEDNIDELLETLVSVEQKMSDCGAHKEAESASQLYDKVRKQARKEGLVP